MFIGHYSAAFLAATLPKAPSLPVLVGATQAVDVLFFGLVIAGVEGMSIAPGFTVMNPMDLHTMPYTHSLAGSVLWAVLFGGVLYFLRHSLATAAIGGGVLLSHWFLDLLVHGPDLTLAGQPPKFGLGLWNYPAIEMPLELALTFGSLWFMARRNGLLETRRVPLLVLGGLLLLLQLYNWFAPPPARFGIEIPLSALVAYALVIFLASRVDRRGQLRTRPAL